MSFSVKLYFILLKARCFGCHNNCPSQIDHDYCLGDTSEASNFSREIIDYILKLKAENQLELLYDGICDLVGQNPFWYCSREVLTDQIISLLSSVLSEKEEELDLDLFNISIYYIDGSSPN